MEEGLFYPLIHVKIQKQHCLFMNNFKQIQTSSHKESTFGPLNGVLKTHLAPENQASSSSNTATERKTIFANPLTRRVILYITSAPVLRVMLLMQSQGELIKSGRLKHPYRGFNDCLATIVRNEGIRSLWNGNTARMMTAIVFYNWEKRGGMVNNVLREFAWDDNERIRIQKTLAAECLSATVIQLVVQPLLYLETRMSNDIITKGSSYNDKRQFNGLIDVLKKTLKTDGIAGVYRGFGIGLGAAMVTRLLFQTEIYYLQNKMYGTEVTHLAYAILMVGLPLSFDLITFPAFTVMRRMMMRSGETNKYRNCFHAFSQIVKNEGFLSLYKGTSALVIAKSIAVTLIPTLPIIMEKLESCYRDHQLPYDIKIRWKKGENNDDDG